MWTNAELIEGALERGFRINGRLISDWTGLGLLDRVQRRKPGPGSIPGVRSNNQARLLWVLLDQRQGVKNIATLTNIPIYLWLNWGDEYVPIRQVRRALCTYSNRHQTSSGISASKTAVLHLESFALNNVPKKARDTLAETLIELGAKPRATLGDLVPKLTKALRGVIAPDGTKIDLPTVENLVWIIGLRLSASSIFVNKTDNEIFNDRVMRQVQAIYRQNTIGYLAAVATPPTAVTQELINNACLNLLTELGRTILGHVPPGSPAAPGAPA